MRWLKAAAALVLWAAVAAAQLSFSQWTASLLDALQGKAPSGALAGGPVTITDSAQFLKLLNGPDSVLVRVAEPQAAAAELWSTLAARVAANPAAEVRLVDLPPAVVKADNRLREWMQLPDTPTLTWKQNLGTAIVLLPVPAKTSYSDVAVRLSSSSVAVSVFGAVAMDGEAMQPIDTEASSWDFEGSPGSRVVALTLRKKAQMLWGQLLRTGSGYMVTPPTPEPQLRLLPFARPGELRTDPASGDALSREEFAASYGRVEEWVAAGTWVTVPVGGSLAAAVGTVEKELGVWLGPVGSARDLDRVLQLHDEGALSDSAALAQISSVAAALRSDAAMAAYYRLVLRKRVKSGGSLRETARAQRQKLERLPAEEASEARDNRIRALARLARDPDDGVIAPRKPRPPPPHPRLLLRHRRQQCRASAAMSTRPRDPPPGYARRLGFPTQGSDILAGPMSLSDAAARCDGLANCVGLTYGVQSSRQAGGEIFATFFLKSRWVFQANVDSGWVSYRKESGDASAADDEGGWAQPDPGACGGWACEDGGEEVGVVSEHGDGGGAGHEAGLGTGGAAEAGGVTEAGGAAEAGGVAEDSGGAEPVGAAAGDGGDAAEGSGDGGQEDGSSTAETEGGGEAEADAVQGAATTGEAEGGGSSDAPQMLSIASPWFFAGVYQLVERDAVNGRPLWKRVTAAPHWLFSTPRGYWAVSGSADDFTKDGGYCMTRLRVHGMPPDDPSAWIPAGCMAQMSAGVVHGGLGAAEEPRKPELRQVAVGPEQVSELRRAEAERLRRAEAERLRRESDEAKAAARPLHRRQATE